MIQTKLKQVPDPASLEGLDHVLDGVFEPQVSPGLGFQSRSISTPNLVAPSADNWVKFERRRPRLARPIPQTPQLAKPTYEELEGQVCLLTARLEYALERLSTAKLEQAILKTQVAAQKDQLRLMPELINKAIRLKELERSIERLVRKAIDLARI